ncbi:MAG: hypothetical protein KDC05_02360 [Bacteroidales bacterium]|nr:hypothetical protein [Bacteroidales bacterium]
MKFQIKLSVFGFLAFLTLLLFSMHSCKKLDLVRIAAVTQPSAEIINDNEVMVTAEIIDLGEENTLSEHGFCWVVDGTPTINDNVSFLGSRSTGGTFEYLITGITAGSNYSVRAFVESESEIIYGNPATFNTTGGNPELPLVTTGAISGITETTATISGNVTNEGADIVTARGICYGTNPSPAISGPHTANGTGTGTFSAQLINLQNNTKYYVRAYAVNSHGIAYGQEKNFTTGSVNPSAVWLHYDDGINSTSIGFTQTQTDFDIAIRFTSTDLIDYDGFNITKVRFYVAGTAPVAYDVSVTWWTGSAPDFVFDEFVASPAINNWTTYNPSYIHQIDASEELWVGLWIVGAPAGTYPAGVDEGPAVSYFGDLISTDDGETWDALSIANPDLDYNWNLQVYVTNEKGMEIPLKTYSSRRTSHKPISSNINDNMPSAKPHK